MAQCVVHQPYPRCTSCLVAMPWMFKTPMTPGISIKSPWVHNQIDEYNGISMSTPHPVSTTPSTCLQSHFQTPSSLSLLCAIVLTSSMIPFCTYARIAFLNTSSVTILPTIPSDSFVMLHLFTTPLSHFSPI